MSFKERVSEGEDFVIEHVSREYGSRPTEAFKISGRTGAVTVGGQPVATSSASYFFGIADGLSGAGPNFFCDLTDALEGDVVVSVKFLSLIGTGHPHDYESSFESVISQNGSILQIVSDDLSTQQFMILLKRSV